MGNAVEESWPRIPSPPCPQEVALGPPNWWAALSLALAVHCSGSNSVLLPVLTAFCTGDTLISQNSGKTAGDKRPDLVKGQTEKS